MHRCATASQRIVNLEPVKVVLGDVFFWRWKGCSEFIPYISLDAPRKSTKKVQNIFFCWAFSVPTHLEENFRHRRERLVGSFRSARCFFLSVGCPTTTAKKQNLDENWWIENGKLPRTIRYRQKNVFHHHRSGLWAIIEATTLCTSKGPEKRVSMMQRFWESSGWLSTYG